MNTLIIHHPDILLHDASAAHVAMAPDRIARTFKAVAAVPGVALVHAEPASREAFLLVHDADFIDNMFRKAPTKPGEFYHYDRRETIMNQHTLRALQLSAGAVCDGVDAVMDGRAKNVFCPVYAGHHAQAGHASGFCFTNQIAIGARHAIAKGLSRVAILDIDTHSGNGTILTLMNDPKILFAETYQPLYPGSFMPGYKPANILRTRVTSQAEFVAAWAAMLPKVAAFDPEIILVSAGFDAHKDDPLGTIKLTDDAYVAIARQILAINTRVVAMLEGGYNIEATPRCAALFVNELVRAVPKV